MDGYTFEYKVKLIQRNPDFSNPHCFELPNNSNQNSFPLLSQTVILPPISRILRYFEPVIVSRHRGLKNRHSTVAPPALTLQQVLKTDFLAEI